MRAIYMPGKKQFEQNQMSNLKEAGNVIERKHVKPLLIYRLRANLFHNDWQGRTSINIF